MDKKILVIYKSVTGFTKQYAQWIAEALNCEAVELQSVSVEMLSDCHTLIFGGRFHAGTVDGWKKVKALFKASGASRLVLFATGATPQTQTDMIEAAWKNNLSAEELTRIPHFYMESGLRPEKMPLGDKLMLKAFAAMLKGKKEKSEYETAMAEALVSSYDHSSQDKIKPLLVWLSKE